jgi:hypothetical protein
MQMTRADCHTCKSLRRHVQNLYSFFQTSFPLTLCTEYIPAVIQND